MVCLRVMLPDDMVPPAELSRPSQIWSHSLPGSTLARSGSIAPPDPGIHPPDLDPQPLRILTNELTRFSHWVSCPSQVVALTLTLTPAAGPPPRLVGNDVDLAGPLPARFVPHLCQLKATEGQKGR